MVYLAFIGTLWLRATTGLLVPFVAIDGTGEGGPQSAGGLID